MENRKYKASFILDMRNCTETIDDVTSKLQNVIVSLGGSVIDTKNLGQKSFEYVVDKKFPNGIYVQIDFESASGVPAALTEKLSLYKSVNRVFIEKAA